MENQISKNTLQIPNQKNKSSTAQKTVPKLTPSQLIKKQLPGQIIDTNNYKPKITQFLNIGDYSINRESCVPIEEPLFEPIPSVIKFTDYEPLQIKTMVFRLRNKDRVARTIKIIQPESRLFQVSLYASEKGATGEENVFSSGSKVAPGLEVKYMIKFSPEAKIDYNYDLHIVTEREKFIVPIIAVGKRAMIDFPDTINFGRDCPVKYITEKPVIIRNLGDKTTKWELKLPSGFMADKKEGVLEFNRSEQIILKFYPTEKKLYEAEAVLIYDNMEAFIPIVGNAINGNVYLKKQLVKLGEPYIGLESQRTVEIVNRSNVKIDFEWRTFYTEAEELEKKELLKMEIDEEEQEKKLMLRDAAALEVNQEMLDIQDDDDSGYEEVDERTMMLTNQRKAELLLQRKYKSIKKSIEENLFLFDHEIFDIKPVTGTIWPNSEMTITVSFRPNAACDYECSAYCNISCSDNRLALKLEGTGLGPKAYLSTSNYNIKEVCVNERKEYTLTMENKGDIPAKFKLLKNNTPFSKMIDFDVKEGVLEVGSRMQFNMYFQSSKVGEFQEVFRWELAGSNEELVLQVRGHVRAPEFEFKEEKLDFGVVSYQFDKFKELELENKSVVKFRFNLRIPGDNKNNEKEFEITPESEEIKPGEIKKIKVRFMPHNKKDYVMVMVLDIEGVGKDMKSIPIYASCDVPKVKLSEKILKYDKVFLRDSKTKTLSLINESNLPARFKIIPQSPETQMIAKFHTEIDEGVIPPLGLLNLGVTLTTFSITEEVRLDLLIKIIANEDIIHTVKLQAISQGPQVKVKEPYINFGDVEVLEETYRTIHISNECSIRADFYAFTKLQNSIFKPIQRHHFLEPHSSMEIEICCVADDTKVFNDTLHFVIKEGLDKEVKLTAKGVGKTIFCKEPLDMIDFQTQYTFRQQTKEIFIENKGRRDQKLEWVRKKPDKKPDDNDKKPQNAKKKEIEEEPTPTFSIFPVVQELPAKKGLMFQFRAVSTKKGKVSEKFILMSTIEGDRKATPLYETEVTGEFINPKLNFDIQHVVFTYDWVKGVPPKMISQNIGITCDSVLPTKFKLIVEKPFSIFPESFDLSAYKKVAARIDFDPTFNSSKRSCVEKRQLKVKHSKHPFVEAIDVVGVFNFPNLELEVHEINFGSVLNDTSKKYVMKMKNVSLMNVEYQWSFLEEENREDEKESIPINEIFDILPLNGTLEPGQIENVEFVYYGLPNKRFESVAICQIEGGPDERVSLVGESSKIDYKLSIHGLKNVIDFGDQAISQWGAKDFRVENLGKVPFDFKIRMDNIVRKGLVKIVPSSGKIAGGSQSRIRIHYCPGLPGDYLENFKIQIAHFEAETITLRGYGLYPALKFELNRVIDAETKKRLEEDRYGLENISLDSNATNLTKKYPEGEVISNLDRKILSDAVMKCLEDRAKGIGSLNSSFADLNHPQQDQPANPAVPAITSNASATAKSGLFRNTSTGAFEKNLYDKINVGTYSIDLGNVIAGSSVQYQFRVYNVGKLPSITINFDQKNIRPAGFRLSNDRFILKNKDKNYEDVKVILQTKKSSPTGRQYFQLPVEIQNGPKYSIDLYCNVTVPELGLSDMEVNFDKVICGQKKIITLRISNDKEVDCNWSIVPKKEQRKKASDPKADNRYTINPSFGTLSAFTKQNIEVTFIPTSDKNYTYTFEVNMQDNQRKLELKCSGDGVVPNLVFAPEETVFDPCLPYDNSCYKCFEIKNQSDFDVELFSLDFDKQFLDEEKMIQSYEPLQKAESLSINVRKPGDPFWRDIKSYYNILQDNIKLNLEINKIKETKDLKEEEKLAQIEVLEKTRKTVQEETKYPNPISENLRRNVILWGPRKCGKTQLAKFLSKEHQRGVINFNEILEWNINSGTPSGKMAQEYLAKRKEEMDLFLVEKEKAKKKKKKGQEEENYYLERFGWVTDEILAQLLKDRMKMSDSNVGNIFDNLYGSFFENELVALKAILEACKNTTAQLVNLGLCINEKGSIYCPIINLLRMDDLERENILENSPPEEKKNKKLVDRRTIEKNKHEKDLAEKEARMNKKNDKKKKEVEEVVVKPVVDPYLPLFDVDDIGELTEAERKAHLEKTSEMVDFFNGKLGDDKIHKLDNYLKKLEEEEEAKNTKDKTKLAKDKEKDKSKGNSNLNSRPLTGKEYTMEDKVEELNPVRLVTNTTIEYNFKQLNLKVRSLVPKVDFPDPVSLPIPDDQILQIMRRKEPRKPKAKLEFFEIFTPEVYIKENYIESKLNEEFKEELLAKNSKVDEIENKMQVEMERLKEEARAKREEERRREEERDESLPQSPPTDDLIESKDIPESAELKSLTGERNKILQEFDEKVSKRKKELMSLAKVDFEVAKLQSMYRWIVPKNKSIVLVLKFFSKKTGEFPNFLEFDNIYSNGRTTKYKIKGVCDFPKISTNPLKVFANRRQTQPTTLPDSLINKIFYLEENRFDFGPLVIGKKDKDKNEKKVLGMNSYTFDIVNEGLYKSNITFDLASNVIDDPDYKKDIFSIHPNFMELEVGQTEKIRVWCVPDEVRHYKEELICMMNHNPIPYVVKMTAQGASPILSVNQKVIEFDRLLVNQTFTKTLVIKNVGPIGAKWKLVGLESLPKEYQFSITSGELRPTKEIQVDIKFSSAIQKKFENEVKVFIEDNEEIGVTQEPIPVSIKAEAFNINVKLDGFGNPENILNFGNVEVGRRTQKTFTVKNEGLYDVKFNFNKGKKVYKDCFEITPNSGEIKPNETKEISVVFKSKEETKLNPAFNKTDIILEILEGKSQEAYNKIPINVNVNSVYSQYTITPMNHINFGPMKFNEQGTKTFEIRNEGLFEFSYAIYEHGDAARIKELKEEQQKIYEEMDTLVIEDKKKGKKEEKPKKAAPPVKKGQLDPTTLAISQYTLTPSYGTILPNSAVAIDVVFKAVGNSAYEAKLCIDITNRSPNMFPEGIPYELQGESCIPMINNSNFELIFEEQIVVPSLNSTGRNIQDIVNSNIFATEERCFYFGTVIPSKNSNEDVKEKFKIVNNGKVHAEVKFQVKKKQSSTTDNFPFSVTSEIAKIPPHEHVYVEVTFAPTIMTTYSAVFEAMVINSDPNYPQFNNLTFDLRGDGAMPTLKLEKPKEWLNESTPLLKFSKTRLGKRSVESIVVKNDGLIPATVKFDVTQHKDFKLISQTSYTLTPKSVQSFQVEYCPNAVGESQWEIFFNTLLNPYEQTKVIVKGECFFEGITFENLPNDKDDQIAFGDVVAGASKKVTFFIKNHTEKNMRISTELNNSECLSVKPSIGHLAKKGTKTFHATIKSDKKLSLEAFKTFFVTQEIKQKEEKWNDWDNSRKKRKMITATEFNWLEACQAAEEKIKAEEQELLRKGKKVPKRAENYLPKKPDISLDEKRDIEYEETIPEPIFEAVGADKKVELLVFAKVDSVKYICDTKNVQFKSTMMFGSRVYEFKVKNDSIIEMQYKWDFLTREGISDPGYYKITPAFGSIGPEQEETFQLKFAPTEIQNDQARRLVCLMPNLAAHLEPLQIQVDSLSERPICHFELELTNYLNSRTGDIPEVDVSKLKVIEFESLGIKVKNRKRFYIVNPTATGYEFVWKRVDVDLGGSANISTFFQCVTEKGVILSGKKFEMSFEYKPEIQGLHESLWVFEIPTFNLKQYFLIVGKVVEPKVFFEVGKVDFGHLLIGGKNKEVIKLKNLDYLPYQFNFNRNSIKGENEYADSLNIEPMSGVLNGDSEIPLTITFKPKIEGRYNYNIICNVAQKPRPINLNVKGIGYMLHHAIYLNNTPAVLNPNVLNEIDFGNIYVNEKKIRTISIKNNGEFNFDFMIKKSSFNYVSIMPETATVKTGSKLDLEVIFNPLKDYKLRPNLHTFTLSIVSGPIYHFKLNGGARKPTVEVSFNSYDFGPCFVMKTPIKKTVILKMRNMDDSAISIEPLFEKKSYLEATLFSGQVLLPFDKDHPETSVLDIPIHFTAREIGKIDEIISFDINQLHKVDVRIQGEGVPMRLDLKRPEDSFIDFGICSVGSNNTMLIPIANQSRSEIKIDFDVDKQLDELRKLFIAILPKGPFLVNAKESKDIEITFNPSVRVNSFKKEIRYKIVENDESVQMLTLQGACQGMDLKLMEDSINFGSVVVGSKLTKKTQLNNLGDMGAKFEWDTTFCKSFFSITPKKGFLPSNDSLVFQIEFHPTVTEDHNFTIRCQIENGNPIMMTLKGKGTSQVTEGLQTLKFESVVRTKTSQKVSIKNPTGEKIMIKANFTTTTDRFKGFFFGQETIQIAPNDKADYEINYLPLTMTSNAKAPKIKDDAHEGRIFFPMPDGSALSFNLVGKSNPPAVIETIPVSFKAKSDTIQIINLKNWLKEAQRLAVSIDPEVKDDSVIIIGTTTIDLPAESSKKYKLNLYALKQGTHKVTVTFRNTTTDEFIFYVLNLTVTPADPIESFELSSVVRESVKKVVSILNPLDRQVEIKKESILCDTDTITFHPRTFIIPAKSEFGLELTYRPLVVAETKNTLKIVSPELGEYLFNMKLSGTGSSVLKSINFKTALGLDIVQTYKFKNFSKKPTQYQVKIEKLGQPKAPTNVKETKAPPNEFTVDTPTINAQGTELKEGLDVSVNIKFEPSSMNEAKSLMTISSVDGGTYQCYLIGQSTNPQPKGPIKISGKGGNLEFKNPFFEACEFTIRIDNPSFTTSVKSPLKLEGKKQLSIPIVYKAVPEQTTNGRVMISTEGMPQWTFYVQMTE